MLKLFGGTRPDHPMADAKEACRILDAASAEDPFKGAEELANWLDSVRATEGFRPDQRAALIGQIDEAAQAHMRRLAREYLASPRLSKFQENRLWTALHDFWKADALAFSACVDLVASGTKGADALKASAPLLAVRALRALAAQIKWLYMRYGPFDPAIWGTVARVYAAAESRNFARTRTAVYPNVPGESSPELEFLKAVMLSASSPDGMTPAEIDIAERLIAHFAPSFDLVLEQQPEIAYWIDLAAGQPPLRLARPPQHAPTLRFFAASRAHQQIERLIEGVRASGAVPGELNLGAADPEAVLSVLGHLSLAWSSKPPERRTPRHAVKSRLTVTHGLEGVLAVLDPASSLDFDNSRIENWVVENVSLGGFGALVPQIKGDWLRIGALVALQPEGGDNWLVGVVRRLSRDAPQRGTVGIETLARAAEAVRAAAAGGAEARAILLDPAAAAGAPEARLLAPAGAILPGQNVETESQGRSFLLMPAGPAEHGDDWELLRFRPMMRDTGE